MTYQNMIEQIQNTIRANNGHMVQTLKDEDGTEYNVYSHEGAKFLLVYKTESGFYMTEARDLKDLEIMTLATKPYCVETI